MKVDTEATQEVDPADTPPTPKTPAKKPKAKVKKAKANGKAKKAKGVKRAPRTRDPAKLDEFGFRKGSIKSKAAMMYKKGATLLAVKEALGGIQFNVLTELESAGYQIEKKAVKGKAGRDATKYKVIAKSK